jgi:hypothetical protein
VREALLSAALSGETDPTEEDECGKRYVLDFEIKTTAGTATGAAAGGSSVGRIRPEVHELLRALGVR